jgi:hypothetical protein
MHYFPFEPERAPVSEQSPAVHPLSYYEQLADAGALYDFLQTNMQERFAADRSFRMQMLRILLDRSNTVLPEVECELLRELSAALGDVLRAVELCHNTQIESQ